MSETKDGEVRSTDHNGYVVVLRRNERVVATISASEKTMAEDIVEQWRAGTYTLLTEGTD